MEHQTPQSIPTSSNQSMTPQTFSRKTNTLAIVAIILAFLVPLVGLILAIVAKSQIKKRGEGGNGLAIAAIIISIINLIAQIGILVLITTMTITDLSRQKSNTQQQTTTIRQELGKTEDERQAIDDSVKFLQDLKDEKYSEAYNLMSPELKKEVGSSESFANEIRDKNLNLIISWQVTEVITNSTGDRITVKGALRANTSNPDAKFEFGFYKQGTNRVQMLSYELRPHN